MRVLSFSAGMACAVMLGVSNGFAAASGAAPAPAGKPAVKTAAPCPVKPVPTAKAAAKPAPKPAAKPAPKPAPKPFLVDRFVSGGAGNCEEIVFTTRTFMPDGHWYANFSYYCLTENDPAYGKGGRLCAYNFKTKKLRVLLEDLEGSMRDPCVHYDGKTILFAYRPHDSANYHLYTIGSDGKNLKQLTSGEYDDLEPCWLPDGNVVFISSRCRRWVNCWHVQVGTIFRMKADGTDIRMLSANSEQDNTPWVLPDGRVLYMRWEYVDRCQVTYHHLWTMNPDGTQHQIYQGNTYPGSVYLDAKPIPGTDMAVLIDSPGHGRRDHGGSVSVVSTKDGPDIRANVKTVCKGTFYDPWAFSADSFMFSDGTSIHLANRAGAREVLFSLPPEFRKLHPKLMLFEPRPLMPHARERILADRTDPKRKTGEFYLENVLESRSMAGVKPGVVKKLRIYELLPKPINFSGGMEPLTFGGSFSLPRQLGTVPVEDDGSAYFTAPALRSLFFVALDAEGRAVKRMQSFTQVMPGERQGCVGCHEQKTHNTVRRVKNVSKALARGPSRIDPSELMFDVADFPRHMQPVLDRNCVKCHNPDKRAAHLDLCGDAGPMYSMGYLGLLLWNQVFDGRNLSVSDWPPYARGSGGSPLMKKIDGSHHGVKLDEKDRQTVMQWLDGSAPYAGTYAALGCGFLDGIKGFNNVTVRSPGYNGTASRPAAKAAVPVVKKRCTACHATPCSLADGKCIAFPNKKDPRNGRLSRMHRHYIFNLSRPEKSLFLMAALAKEAGGLGLCTNGLGKAVFATKDDPDYRTMLAAIQDGKAMLDKESRFDRPDFQPNAEYLREMRRYGILPKDFDATKDRVDPYELDRKYWAIDWTTIK